MNLSEINDLLNSGKTIQPGSSAHKAIGEAAIFVADAEKAVEAAKNEVLQVKADAEKAYADAKGDVVE